MRNRQVVITGLGVVAPNGVGKNEFWDSLIKGRSGVKRISSFDASSFPSQIAGEITDFDACKYMDAKTVRRTGKFTHFAVASAKMALADSQIGTLNGDRTQIYIGSAAGGRDVSEREHTVLREKGSHGLSPFSSAAIITNAAAVEVSIELGCKGKVTTVSTGCTAGLDAVGSAYNEIQAGKIDIAVAGGTDGSVTPLTLGCLCAAGIISKRNEEPEKASRPFDAKRDGGILSEGAGIVILEEMEHAFNRNAFVYGEIRGYSTSVKASSLFETDVGGNGFIREMKRALEQASLNPTDIDYISAHAPSDIIRDKAETYAIKEVFGDCAYKIPVSSVKSMIGNPFASAGPMQLIASLMAMKEGVIPPTINYEYPDPECDLDYVPNEARRNRIKTVLINSHGFGGSDSSLIISKCNGVHR